MALAQTIEPDSILPIEDGFEEYVYIPGVKLENDLSLGGTGSKVCRATHDVFDTTTGHAIYVGSHSVRESCGGSGGAGLRVSNPGVANNRYRGFSSISSEITQAAQAKWVLDLVLADLCRSNAPIAKGIHETFQNAESNRA